MRKQSVLFLFGLLSIAVILGCGQSGENAFQNPVAGNSATNVNTTPSPGLTASNSPAGKVKICHYVQEGELDCGGPGNTVVIRVSGNAFDGSGQSDHTSHGDFTTELAVGTCGCDW